MEKGEKKQYRPLQKMFMEVPGKYDKLNRMLTWRFDESWRKQAVKEILLDNPGNVLDLCTGTGDLIIGIAKKAKPNTKLTALDYSPPMLEIAKQKSGKKDLPAIGFIHGDVADMPFPDDHFDAIGIAFAFRNLTYKNPDQQKFIKEIFRITKPGGKFVIIETSQPRNKFFKSLFKAYMTLAVEKLGGAISGHKTAYKYLAHSAKNFYSAEEVCELLMKAGFGQVKYRQFVWGVASLHAAMKEKATTQCQRAE